MQTTRTSRIYVTSLLGPHPSDFHSSLRVGPFQSCQLSLSVSVCLSVSLPSCLPVSSSSICSVGKRRNGNIKLSSLSSLTAGCVSQQGNCTNKSSSGERAPPVILAGVMQRADGRTWRLSQREIDSQVSACESRRPTSHRVHPG